VCRPLTRNAQIRSTGAIAVGLWLLELLLQLGSSLLEGGAIALAKEQGKLNKDLFLLGGTFAITLCMMYSNVRAAPIASRSVLPDALRCCQFRLVWEARRCSLWVEGRSRRRRKRPEQRGGTENPLSRSRR